MTKARHAEAEPLMRRALAIDEASLGAEHPNVAIRLNNLALLLQDTNRLAEAEPLYRRALAIDETSFGTKHPKVAIHLTNLAALLKATNRLTEAESLMRQALLIALQFTRHAERTHHRLGSRLGIYRGLLAAMDLGDEEQEQHINALGAEAGFGKEEFRALLDGL